MIAKKQPELIDAVAHLKRRKKPDYPRWLDDPTVDGEYYVDWIHRVCYVYREYDDGPWLIEYIGTNPDTLAREIRWEPLGGRRVAPCTGRPAE